MFRNILYIAVFFYNLSNCFSQTGWNLQTSNINQDLHSVQFINSNAGWCVGDSGVILQTTNGGTNWFSQSSGSTIDLLSLSMISSSTGYAAGDSGLIIKTTNGGFNWNNLNAPITSFLKSVFFVNENLGYAGGYNIQEPKPAYIYKTINGGYTWDSIAINVAFITSLQFINSLTGWATVGSEVISSEDLIKTTNGGINWVTQHSSGIPPLRAVFFIDSLNGWSSGRYFVPTIFRSTDSGNSWSSQFPGIGYTVNSIYAINTQQVWAVSEEGNILHTSNGGINWSDQFVNSGNSALNSVNFSNQFTGWTVGDKGKILKTTTGGVLTDFSNNNSEVPLEYGLEQNYPNPFNPKTVINYQLPFSSEVKIKIYNVLGNEIETLVDKKQKSGSYSVAFDGSDYPSGVYLYRLEIDGNVVDTKRMVLLK